MKRTISALVLAVLPILGTGCAHCSWVYAPFGPGTLCSGSPGHGQAASSCGSASCGAGTVASACHCDDGCGGGCTARCTPGGPLTWLFALLNAGYCGDGCGEIWWGDFHGAPPACCEPCNRMGDYVGGHGRAPLQSSGECTSCGEGHTIDYTFQQPPRILADSRPNIRPAPAPAPVRQAAKPIPAVKR